MHAHGHHLLHMSSKTKRGFELRRHVQVYMLDRTGGYVQEQSTARLQVPFFVKSTPDFQQKYPVSSASRYDC